MARLVVQGVISNPIGDLTVVVAVSRAETGEPVAGLVRANFRVAAVNAGSSPLQITKLTELTFAPDATPAGAYSLTLQTQPASEFATPGTWLNVPLVVQVAIKKKNGAVVDAGLTVFNAGYDLRD